MVRGKVVVKHGAAGIVDVEIAGAFEACGGKGVGLVVRAGVWGRGVGG